MHEIIDFLLRHGTWVLFIWVLAEQLGIPVPSIPIFLAMGALIGTGARSFSSVMPLIFIAAILGDSVWYALGRRNGHSVLRLLCRISIEPDSCVSSTQAWFKLLDAWTLVVSKFIPGLGSIATPMAGLLAMPWWKFLLADGAGIFLWATCYLGIGDLFRAQLEDAARLLSRTGAGLAAIAGLLALLWVAWKFWQRKRFIRKLRVARITPEEIVDRLPDFAVIDLRSSTEVEWEGRQIPTAIWFDRQELALHHDLIPRDKDVILYCT
ncbi:MAG TPA: VTT domain-containing protein [Bryobacteraceae bacterium]|nr:VTT domain-containing protein [Bryobacteraceae bacterium]